MLPYTRVLGLWALIAPAALGLDILQGQQYEDKCTYTTWNGETSMQSPLANDCLVLAKKFGDGHYGWYVNQADPKIYTQLWSYGTCALGVRPVTKGGNANFFFGSTDAHDIVFDATMRYKNSKTGRIGARGVAHCELSDVEWAVFHKA
ncbi:hypothetical protein PG993_001424 [Apiospora rasikravindrae]|uniref:Ecp2 effector protein-like domain-containing protein n=1 Tax=Apiospora rasikravindrae TaxID=990691 RepID=A0ABR1UBY3_9PEZI